MPGKRGCKHGKCKTEGRAPKGATVITQHATPLTEKTVNGAGNVRLPKKKGAKKGKAGRCTCTLRAVKTGAWVITTEALWGVS